MPGLRSWIRRLSSVLLALTTAGTAAAPLSWGELQDLPLPAPGARISYGSAVQQFGELRLPSSGKGPFPVMILLHGGCWQSEYDYVYLTRLAAWITAQGIATWTPEYRRLGDPGGGWPGTFLDVAAATDALRTLARTHPLDLNRVFTAGHSAGGQLALWLASRGQLAPDSALYVPAPLPIRGVLGLAAITDLTSYRIGPPGSCHASVDVLMGGTPTSEPRRYADASPLQRLPLKIPQVFLQGDQDPIVAPASVAGYVAAATAAGDRAEVLPLTGAGHFDPSVPIPASVPALTEALKQLLHPPTSPTPTREPRLP